MTLNRIRRLKTAFVLAITTAVLIGGNAGCDRGIQPDAGALENSVAKRLNVAASAVDYGFLPRFGGL